MAQRQILALRHGRKISCFLAYIERCNGCNADTPVLGTGEGLDRCDTALRGRQVPHAHVSGNGPNTTIGLDMQPMKNHPALSSKQYSVVEKNWEAITNAIIQIFGR